MRCEIDAIDDSDAALIFAIGTLIACLHLRSQAVMSSCYVNRLAIVVPISTLSLFTANATRRLVAYHPEAAPVWAGLTAALLATALWAAVRGAQAVIQPASLMLAINAAGYGLLCTVPADSPGALYRALTGEGLVIWAALLVTGLVLGRREQQTLIA